MALWKIVKKMKELRSKLDEDEKGPKSLKKGQKPSRRDNKRLGRFHDDRGHPGVSIMPNDFIRSAYRRNDRAEGSTQAIEFVKQSPMNTSRLIFQNVLVRHEEGGWPKDINLGDPESVARYRKKLEKDEKFQAAFPQMAEEMESLIKINNTMDVYFDLFLDRYEFPVDRKQRAYCHIIGDCCDASESERAVNCITWSTDQRRIAVAYCPLEFDPVLRTKPSEWYIFNVEVPRNSEGALIAPSPLVSVQYHHKEDNSIIGSMFNGQVGVWDTRVGPEPQGICAFEVAHKDIATCVRWVNSKTGTEFFSGGLDGQIIWWDERNLKQAVENTWLDPEKGYCREEHSVGCTTLEYEHSLPTKFSAGTQNGDLMIMMRKGKSPNEKLIHLYKSHHGNTKSLSRNPMFIKNILSVGADCIRIIAEDCRESSIMWTSPQQAPYSYGSWIPTRPSVFIACRMDGMVDLWDLLRHPVRPLLSTKVSTNILTTLCPSENGKLVAIGTERGKVLFLQLADYMTTFSKQEKPLLAGTFERESRREKFLEQRHREIRLRRRDKDKLATELKRIENERQSFVDSAKQKEAETGKKVPIPEYKNGRNYDISYEAQYDPLVMAEKEFFLSVDAELLNNSEDIYPTHIPKGETTDEDEECSEASVVSQTAPHGNANGILQDRDALSVNIRTDNSSISSKNETLEKVSSASEDD